MSKLDEKVQTAIDYVGELADGLDPEDLWEFYSMLHFRFRSKIDDLEDARSEKDSETNN